jgi:octaprenyl-diphosphate synthase
LDLVKEIHQYLEYDIKKMNSIIVDSLSVEEELVQLISNYLANSGGKRMRPILTILSAKMFGYEGDNSIKLAAAVEFIHMATLLHDDVVDGSKMRRFLPSANVVWGNKASILVGDFLFSQSFKLMVETNSLSALGVLANAATIIAEGEVAQLAKLEAKKMLTIAEYNKIVDAKTAELFASACQVGGIISDQSDDYNLYLRLYGLKLGHIFQVVDDLLDYDSDASTVGKNIGDDFREGKVTLPFIFLFSKLLPDQKEKLSDLIFADARSDEDFIYAQSLIKELDIKSETMAYLSTLKIEALEYLDHIKIDNQYKNFLKSLVDFAIARSY